MREGNYFTPSHIRTDNESAALRTIPMVVIDPASFEITVNVPSYERSRIKMGLPVAIIPGGDESEGNGEVLATRSGESLEALLESFAVRGEVFSINPAVNPGGRTIQVKIRVKTGHGSLNDGMFVTLWIAAEARTSVVIAPLDAFVYRENQPFVLVVDSRENVARLRSVRVGMEDFANREILAGVEPGEKLVTTGRFLIGDGAPIKTLAPETGNSVEAR